MTFEEFSLIIGQAIWRLNDRMVELVIRLLVKITHLYLFLSRIRHLWDQSR